MKNQSNHDDVMQRYQRLRKLKESQFVWGVVRDEFVLTFTDCEPEYQFFSRSLGEVNLDQYITHDEHNYCVYFPVSRLSDLTTLLDKKMQSGEITKSPVRALFWRDDPIVANSPPASPAKSEKAPLLTPATPDRATMSCCVVQ